MYVLQQNLFWVFFVQQLLGHDATEEMKLTFVLSFFIKQLHGD